MLIRSAPEAMSRISWICTFLLMSPFMSVVVGQEAKTSSEKLIDEIEQVFSNDTVYPTRYSKWIAASDARIQLEKFDDSIVPEIETAIAGTRDSDLKKFYAFCLQPWEGEQTDKLLLKLYLEKDVVSGTAFNVLHSRARSGHRLTVPVPETEIDYLIAQVKNGTIEQSIHSSLTLAVLSGNPFEKRFSSVLNRFRTELVKADSATPNVDSSSEVLSEEALNLGGLSSVFQFFGPEGSPRLIGLLDEFARTGIDQETWVILALGYSGEMSVARDIERLCIDKSNPLGVRVLAIESYEHAVGKDGISFLETLLEDDYVSTQEVLPDGSALYPVRQSAQVAIRRIEAGAEKP